MGGQKVYLQINQPLQSTQRTGHRQHCQGNDQVRERWRAEGLWEQLAKGLD